MAEECTDEFNIITPIDSINETLKILLSDNIAHFKEDDTELGQRMYNGLYALQDGLVHMLTVCEPIRRVCKNYDLSPEEPGNGFRSSVNMAHTSVMRVFELLKQISTGRGALLFSKKYYVKEVEAWSQAVSALATMLDYLNTVVLPHCEDGELLPFIETTPTEVFSLMNTISQYAFYGRCHAFQYYESMQKVFKALSITLCAFSEVYYSDGGFMQRTKQSLMTGSKYMLNPELRARRLVDVVQFCSIDFIKSFWALAEIELMSKFATLVGCNILVEESVIVPCEDLEIPSVDGRLLVIKAPSSCILPNPIPCFLLSASLRSGMHCNNVSKSAKIHSPSDVIIFHCHGGGFVSQSTKTQLVFLRDWADKTDVPIFSVDYSLSPNAKYPRALEEILTCYVWMLNNFTRLGSTGKKIILTGDSGGGNMLASMTIKCAEMGIRIPDALFLIYTPFTLKIMPSASRILEIMDPLLPLGFAVKCLKAYAYLPESTDSQTASKGSSSTDKSVDSKQTTNLPKDDAEIYEIQSESESFVEVSASDLKVDTDTMATVSLNSNSTANNGRFQTPTSADSESSGDVGDTSRKYVMEFLDKYVIETRVDKEGRSIPILRSLQDKSEDEVSSVERMSFKLGKARDAMWDGISAGMTSLGITKRTDVSSHTGAAEKKLNERPYLGTISLGTSLLKDDSNSLLDQLGGVDINSSYYINPYYAPRETLAKFPPTYIMSAEYDFALDDSVMMAKLLRSLGVKTKLKVLDKLPHGFLTLSLISKDANEGNKVAIDLLQELIHLNETEC